MAKAPHSRIAVRLATLALLVASAAAPAIGSISIYMSVDDVAAQAELVVEAQVTRVGSGLDPSRDSLATYVTLEIERVHRGPADLKELTLREAGGAFGGFVHEVDAVPRYVPGQRVLAFLEPAADGTLRTAGMFYGLLTLEQDLRSGRQVARRALDGHGTILRRPADSEPIERFELTRLIRDLPADPGSGVASGAFRNRPAEWSRLAWGPIEERWPVAESSPNRATRLTDVQGTPDSGASPADGTFVPSVPSAPARWQQTDFGETVRVHVDSDRNPLGDPQAAVLEVERALAAWTLVPEARLTLGLGNPGFDYLAAYSSSPRNTYTGVNIVLFGDPYDDITASAGCTGVLAVGGYWRSTTPGRRINGVDFYPALQLYTIVNDGFECFLADPDNLSEVLTHEIGHGLGFGHSTAPDALMRATAYGDRGPRLGDDDRDAVHCVYPHTFAMLAPASGDVWQAGEVHGVQWAVSSESGPDPGTVDLQYSTNQGTTWKILAAAVPNSGSYAWSVADDPSPDVRIRVVRHPRGSWVPTAYPATCSASAPSAAFAILPPAIRPGAVGDGSDAPPLLLEKISGGLRLTWSSSCSADADDYAVYSGSLHEIVPGTWNPLPLACSTRNEQSIEVAAAPGSTYYLVSARAGALEGPFGTGAGGNLRLPSAAACAPRGATPACSGAGGVGPSRTVEPALPAGFRAVRDPVLPVSTARGRAPGE